MQAMCNVLALEDPGAVSREMRRLMATFQQHFRSTTTDQSNEITAELVRADLFATEKEVKAETLESTIKYRAQNKKTVSWPHTFFYVLCVELCSPRLKAVLAVGSCTARVEPAVSLQPNRKVEGETPKSTIQ